MLCPEPAVHRQETSTGLGLGLHLFGQRADEHPRALPEALGHLLAVVLSASLFVGWLVLYTALKD